MIIGLEWNQYEGFDPRLRFKVRAPLPNMSRRFDLLLGRVDEGAFVSDSQGQDQTFYNPGVIDRGQEDTWLLGLGHRRDGGRQEVAHRVQRAHRGGDQDQQQDVGKAEPQ